MYGTGFRICVRAKTWKERSFKEKILFWKDFSTAIEPLTSEELHQFNRFTPNSTEVNDKLLEDFRKSLEGENHD